MIPRPKCQCKERKEAIIRMKDATLRGDMEAVAIEAAFIKKSAAEDAAALNKWAMDKIASKMKKVG